MVKELNRKAIFDLLEENDQQPQYQNKSNTLIETRSGGIFYVLEYNGSGRIGWSVSDNRLQEIKSYSKHAILFINATEGEMYIILESNHDFFNKLNNQVSPYKIDKKDVENFKISYESLDEYLRSL